MAGPERTCPDTATRGAKPTIVGDGAKIRVGDVVVDYLADPQGLRGVAASGAGSENALGEIGGAEEDRTPDLRIANASLSQLSYGPTRRRTKGASGVARLLSIGGGAVKRLIQENARIVEHGP